MESSPTAYITTELELASFLRASGQYLLCALPRGRLIEFHFPREALEQVDAYFSGAQLPARDLFEAHRSLRALIQQVKERQNQSERNRNYDSRKP
jgi:hypothetical protein